MISEEKVEMNKSDLEEQSKIILKSLIGVPCSSIKKAEKITIDMKPYSLSAVKAHIKTIVQRKNNADDET